MLNANILETLIRRRRNEAEQPVDCRAYYIDSRGTEPSDDAAGAAGGDHGGSGSPLASARTNATGTSGFGGGGSRRGGSPANMRLGDGVRTRIQYFDDDSLRKFLFHGQKHEAAILQRFVPPSGDANHIIRVMWSPQVLDAPRRGRGREECLPPEPGLHLDPFPWFCCRCACWSAGPTAGELRTPKCRWQTAW